LYEKEKKKKKWDMFSINRTPTLMGVPVFKTPHTTTMKEKNMPDNICPILTIKNRNRSFRQYKLRDYVKATRLGQYYIWPIISSLFLLLFGKLWQQAYPHSPQNLAKNSDKQIYLEREISYNQCEGSA
jgi:hypothetical protein